MKEKQCVVPDLNCLVYYPGSSVCSFSCVIGQPLLHIFFLVILLAMTIILTTDTYQYCLNYQKLLIPQWYKMILQGFKKKNCLIKKKACLFSLEGMEACQLLNICYAQNCGQCLFYISLKIHKHDKLLSYSGLNDGFRKKKFWAQKCF